MRRCHIPQPIDRRRLSRHRLGLYRESPLKVTRTVLCTIGPHAKKRSRRAQHAHATRDSAARTRTPAHTGALRYTAARRRYSRSARPLGAERRATAAAAAAAVAAAVELTGRGMVPPGRPGRCQACAASGGACSAAGELEGPPERRVRLEGAFGGRAGLAMRGRASHVEKPGRIGWNGRAGRLSAVGRIIPSVASRGMHGSGGLRRVQAHRTGWEWPWLP